MTSKEQIISFLETIPTMDLPEVFEALNWICEKRGIPLLRSEDHEDFVIRYADNQSVIEQAIECLEEAKYDDALNLLLEIYAN